MVREYGIQTGWVRHWTNPKPENLNPKRDAIGIGHPAPPEAEYISAKNTRWVGTTNSTGFQPSKYSNLSPGSDRISGERFQGVTDGTRKPPDWISGCRPLYPGISGCRPLTIQTGFLNFLGPSLTSGHQV